ncbi:molybdenum cofactor guanylyltransferase [Betaproteobacteria bacterium SCN1]|jgi:molybdopterin-guanine dinucleotide biosynthesis protein A|nr:molybdenum cofactor guanylyltransferase [Betaproteobacteria bacterium SCN1]MBN8760085.1 molybdenum cofactor guanylyltransferase [Thiobacillus sp.]ODU90796.1 MAG: molybdenum cofactor guanylyltransferase [Thiobacillus sp. SCN 65-179]OJW35778.1 MAG: molybdenum cofactor guanylyltransferase [Thiobacillus sp. 65-69]
MSAAELAAVVLAGGRGLRMGGADKGLVDYRGRPLVAWVLDALAPQAGEILISANRNLERYAAFGHRVLPDTLPDFPGPLAGVLATLRAVATPWLLVAPCDTPHLPPDLGARLLGAARQAGTAIAVAADDTRTHPACFVVRTDLADDLAACLARGERAVRHWQAPHRPAMAYFDAAGFVNFNRPEDLGPAGEA